MTLHLHSPDIFILSYQKLAVKSNFHFTPKSTNLKSPKNIHFHVHVKLKLFILSFHFTRISSPPLAMRA